ncbi:Protein MICRORCHIDIA 6 [Vitis vinifera]|uniref:Protein MICRORCHIDIA 6 n=1 Tax=Vitis vinifera TaxID=29760 RepID=A0A438EZ26_VITVI|nr:Protein MICRORCHIDIA 6 [Vitis vinifera]
MSFPDIVDLCSDDEHVEVDVKPVKLEPNIIEREIQLFKCHEILQAQYQLSKTHCRTQESEENRDSNALSTAQSSTSILDQGQSPMDDTSLSSTSPICPAPLCRQFWKAGNYDDELGSKVTLQNGKNYLHVHPMFLHSNATSHKWAFGAIAELLDNAVDEDVFANEDPDLDSLIFNNAKDTQGVWRLGCCSIEGKSLRMDWWSLEAGCLKEGGLAKETWIRDVKAVEKRHLQWARVLVFSNEERMPRNLHMMVGSLAYAVQLLGVFTKVVGGFSKKGLQSVEVLRGLLCSLVKVWGSKAYSKSLLFIIGFVLREQNEGSPVQSKDEGCGLVLLPFSKGLELDFRLTLSSVEKSADPTLCDNEVFLRKDCTWKDPH